MNGIERRIEQVQGMLGGSCTKHGECEGCRAERVALWEDRGGMYCRVCWGGVIARLRRMLVSQKRLATAWCGK